MNRSVVRDTAERLALRLFSSACFLESFSGNVAGSDMNYGYAFCGLYALCDDQKMSTPVFVELEISTHADGAQSPRVPVPFPKDPYEAIRQAYLVETETPESPHTVASPTPLLDSTPAIRHAEDSVDSDTSGARPMSSDFTAPPSLDHPLS
ncbi:hypothetical protein Tco_0633897 [Tanacetum coccineum]